MVIFFVVNKQKSFYVQGSLETSFAICLTASASEALRLLDPNHVHGRTSVSQTPGCRPTGQNVFFS